MAPRAIGGVAAAAAALFVVGLFFPFWTYRGDSVTAFSSGLFPLAVLGALFGAPPAIDSALQHLAGVGGSWSIAGLPRRALRQVLAVVAAIVLLAFLVQDRGASSLGIGYWLMLLGSFLGVAAAILDRSPAAATAVVPPAPAVVEAVGLAAPTASPAAVGTTPIVSEPTGYWCYVTVASALHNAGDPTTPIGWLTPGQWYQVTREEAGWALVDDGAGHVGWVAASSTHRAPATR